MNIERKEAHRWLESALQLPNGQTPFPWQRRLLDVLLEEGRPPRAVDLPTGLGKTSTMAIWLVARAAGAPVPRRLVYVVDRRAVVDQATDVAEGLRAWVERHGDVKAALGLPPGRALPISTLRGQHVDNREWLEDPSWPAIVVGTVDMVGSRLLFEGYGVSRKMRPYHAGLLGTDTLVVLDEAHLVPPFAHLLERAADDASLRGRAEASGLLPPFQFMQLSATQRSEAAGEVFGLQPEDRAHAEVARRLRASKRVSVIELPTADDPDKAWRERVVKEAWPLARRADGTPQRVLLFCNRRTDAQKVAEELRKRFVEVRELPPEGKRKKPKKQKVVTGDVELFVGARRVFERQQAAERLAALGFLAERAGQPPERPAVLVATSAAEVGVDLDADHLVCDLVSWERMVQRLGRVNRRGRGEAEVVVVRKPKPLPTDGQRKALEVPEDSRNKKQSEAARKYEEALEAWRVHARPFEHLPELSDGGRDGSPAALVALGVRAASDQAVAEALRAATSEEPLRPPMSRALLDAWSMTSLQEHPGRPEPQPWLRGWTADRPQTVVAWRRLLPVNQRGEPLAEADVAAFFEAAPVHLSEQLEADTDRVRDWLLARAEKVASRLEASEVGEPTLAASEEGEQEPEEADEVRETPWHRDALAAVLLSPGGAVKDCWTLGQLASLKKDGEGKERLQRGLAGGQLVVDRRLGGLSEGLLDPKHEEPPRTADGAAGEWLTDDEGTVVTRWRVRRTASPQPLREADWRERLRLVCERSEEGEPLAWLVVDKWRHEAATEEDRSAAPPQLLEEHLQWTAERARTLAERLGLQAPWREALVEAAALHDRGKAAERWQRAFHAPSDGVYAKTLGPIDQAILGGYRHELGSLLLAQADGTAERLRERLGAEAADLALHLVAAHHGFARPWISTRGCEQAPPSRLRDEAERIAARFVELQRAWGPWGLAWWEALLRAADQQASRDNDTRADRDGEEQGNGGIR